MKKFLLTTATFAGLTFAAITPATAQDAGLKLGVSGFMVGYAVYTDEEGANLRSFDFRKAAEIVFKGETKLENGLTVGANVTLEADRGDYNDSKVEQSYLYASNEWGRLNFGEADGAAFLLQVAAPSADSMVDSVSPEINTFITTGNALGLGYRHSFTERYANKLTYMTPVLSGFQAAVSYAPSLNDSTTDGTTATTTDNDLSQLDNAFEVSARYKGSFQPMDLTLGAGYSHASEEADAAAADSAQIWDAGAVVNVGAFNIGGAYLKDNLALSGDFDRVVWVLGADYDFGATKVGVSYQDHTRKQGAGAADWEAQRYTLGATYDFATGMSFRGSVGYLDRNNAGTPTGDATQVAVGTVLNF